MARTASNVRNTPKSTATVAQPTVAMRLAAGFDRAKASVVDDIRKPATESKTKQAGAVALVAGLAIGAWEFAGM
jgi:hypothetical protein